MIKNVGLFSKAAVIIVVLNLFGCATIWHNPNHEINFTSDPDSAKVYIDGQYVGEAPVVYKVDARKTHDIEFKKEGYKNRTYQLEKSVGAGWVVLDIIFGLIPVIIDAATGQWFNPSDEDVQVGLEKE